MIVQYAPLNKHQHNQIPIQITYISYTPTNEIVQTVPDITTPTHTSTNQIRTRHPDGMHDTRHAYNQSQHGFMPVVNEMGQRPR